MSVCRINFPNEQGAKCDRLVNYLRMKKVLKLLHRLTPSIKINGWLWINKVVMPILSWEMCVFLIYTRISVLEQALFLHSCVWGS
ncbi:hypothetical protein CKY10_18415 [Photorhabdus sp. HUG-39]|nr:hypothetical protein CKY10_18415 [Photorhabdus sp. HUG-39]